MWTSRVIEFGWLAALISVPLAFDGQSRLAFTEQPKQFALHLTAGIIAVTWAIELALLSDRRKSLPSIPTWLGRSPSRWAVASVATFAVVGVLSTATSRVPVVSLWGRNFEGLGYELYSFLTLLILFMAVALRLRGRDQIQRVVYVFILTGTVTAAYGVFQHFGWDPIGFGENQSRVWSTLLNPIFFGSFLVMAVPVTMATAFSEASGRRRRWWILLAGVIGLQLAALWFTGSRGPLVGIVAGGAVMVGVAVTRLERTVLLRGLLISAGGLVVAALLVLVPAGETRGAGSIFGEFAEAGQIGSALAGLDQVADAGFTNRAGIWRGAIDLATSWETQPSESGVSSVLRPVLGFGPEMYAYSYPLTSKPRDSIAIGHAHNFLLQLLLEMGAVGLVTFLVIAMLILVTLLRLLWPGSNSRPDLWVSVVAIGLIGALAGRAVEQMGGVARIGDLAPFWILMALAGALSETVSNGPGSSSTAMRVSGSSNVIVKFSAVGLMKLGGAVLVIVVVVGTFFLQDVRQLRASRAGAEADQLAAAGLGTAALREYQRAVDMAPDVSEYPISLFEHVRNAAIVETDPVNRRALLELGHEALIKYAKRDPYNFAVRERLALAAVSLLEDGQEERRNEVIDRYLDLGEALPKFFDFQAVVANGLLIAGAFDFALDAANYSITLEADQTYAWWVKGVALAGLGDEDGAAEAFERSIVIRPEDRHSAFAHRSYGDLLESQGKLDEAAFHRARQAEIESQLNQE